MTLLPFMDPMHRTGKVKKRLLYYSWGGTHDPLSETGTVDILEKFPSYVKAAFVRNPWDRMFSAFYHNAYLHPDRNKHGFERMISRVKTQAFFLRNKHGVVDMDFVGRFESLEVDFYRLCDMVNIPRIKLMHKNANPLKPATPYWKFYNKKRRDAVYRYFTEDIELFGYEFKG
jgi:hypothetical protein